MEGSPSFALAVGAEPRLNQRRISRGRRLASFSAGDTRGSFVEAYFAITSNPCSSARAHSYAPPTASASKADIGSTWIQLVRSLPGGVPASIQLNAAPRNLFKANWKGAGRPAAVCASGQATFEIFGRTFDQVRRPRRGRTPPPPLPRCPERIEQALADPRNGRARSTGRAGGDVRQTKTTASVTIHPIGTRE